VRPGAIFSANRGLSTVSQLSITTPPLVPLARPERRDLDRILSEVLRAS